MKSHKVVFIFSLSGEFLTICVILQRLDPDPKVWLARLFDLVGVSVELDISCRGGGEDSCSVR